MTDLRALPENIPPLRELFGDTVAFEGAGGAVEAYRILSELTLNGNRYALLQTEAMRREDGFDIFRLTTDEEGEPQLESVEDDEEWEAVAEAYDDTWFGADDRL